MRSPPDHTASPDGPQGAAMSVHQGASEESTFWFLACSGALLTQRSILVAAQCVADEDKRQPLQPAQVKVVIDTRSQKSKDRPKGLHHLTVHHSTETTRTHPDRQNINVSCKINQTAANARSFINRGNLLNMFSSLSGTWRDPLALQGAL